MLLAVDQKLRHGLQGGGEACSRNGDGVREAEGGADLNLDGSGGGVLRGVSLMATMGIRQSLTKWLSSMVRPWYLGDNFFTGSSSNTTFPGPMLLRSVKNSTKSGLLMSVAM